MSERANEKVDTSTKPGATADLSQYAQDLFKENHDAKFAANPTTPHKFSDLSDEQLTAMSKNKSQQQPENQSNQLNDDKLKVNQSELAAIKYKQQIEDILHPKPSSEQAPRVSLDVNSPNKIAPIPDESLRSQKPYLPEYDPSLISSLEAERRSATSTESLRNRHPK